MSNDSFSIISKVWNYARVLKNAGVGYGDYVEVRASRVLFSYLLVLKIAEQHQIVAELEARTTAIAPLEAQLDRQITRSDRLRQSTLAAAFRGKLEDRAT